MAQQDYVEQDLQDTHGSHALVAYQHYQTPRVQGFLMPLGDIAEAKAAISAYEALKSAIVRDDDKQMIQGRVFLKKSFWRRVAACFGLSLELANEERVILDGKLAYRATYRAVAPNGRIMDGDGMCMQGEKGQMIEHNIRAIAHTRAKNRAISDLVGGGEVSAEEMPDEETRGSGSVTPVEPPKGSSQQFHPDVMRLSRDHGLLELLGEIGVKDTTEQRKKLDEIRIWLGERGKTFDVRQVKSLLNAQLARQGTPEGEAVVTEIPAEELGDLRNLNVGQRGN